MFEPAKRSKQTQRIFRYERNEEKMQQLKSTQRRKHPTKTIHQHCHSHKPSRRLWFTQKTESYFFHRQTAPSVYSSPKAQHRSLFIHNFPQQCPSFSIPHTFRNRPKKLVARLTSLHQPPLTKSRPIWSDPIRAQHFQHYTSVRSSVLPLVRISPEGLTVKYIFVMVACPCPGWFWQLNSATNTPPDHRPR